MFGAMRLLQIARMIGKAPTVRIGSGLNVPVVGGDFIPARITDKVIVIKRIRNRRVKIR